MNLKNEVKYIPLVGLLDYKRQNIEYNTAIQGLVDNIFVAEIIGKRDCPILYQKSTKQNIEVNSYKRNSLGIHGERLVDEDYQKPLSEKFENTSKLGFLETGFINFLLQAKADLVVLKGYRGTGKSELIRFVSDYMIQNIRHNVCEHYDKCTIKKMTHLIINFNEGQFSTSEAFINDLQVRIFNDLGASMTELFDDSKNNNNSIIDNFINKCEKESTSYWFNIKEQLTDSISEWAGKSDKEKYRILFTNIQKKYETSSITNGLTAFYEIVKYYNTHYPRQKCCFSLIMDNCDHLEISQQNDLVAVAKGISSATGIPVIIPVRLTTFSNIKGYGNPTFKSCTNIGYAPVEMCMLRMEHYIKNKNDEIYDTSGIPRVFLNAFNKRIEYVYHKMSSFDRLDKTLNALSGVSIRKALTLIRRLFINNVIDWEESEPKEDVLIRSFYSYTYDNGRMNPDKDNRIHNIFQDKKEKVLTVNYLRIINTLKYCEDNSISITLNDLKSSLSLYNSINEEKFWEFIDVLWTQRKRLITLVDVGTKEPQHKQLSSTIDLTKSGYKHLDYLSSNLQYIQNCFEIIDLDRIIDKKETITTAINYIERNVKKTESKKILIKSIRDIEDMSYKEQIPRYIDYNDLGSRLKFIRLILRLMFMKDAIETIIYICNLKKSKNEHVRVLSKISNITTVPIVLEATKSVVNITKNSRYEERQDWLNLLVLVNNWNSALFPSSDYKRRIEHYIEGIEKEERLL